MNKLKIVRAIAFGTAVVAAVICICIIVFKGLLANVNVTDEQFFVTVIIFFISTLYALAVDALIGKDDAETDDMKKIHQTTFNQCIVMMIVSIIGALSLIFL